MGRLQDDLVARDEALHRSGDRDVGEATPPPFSAAPHRDGVHDAELAGLVAGEHDGVGGESVAEDLLPGQILLELEMGRSGIIGDVATTLDREERVPVYVHAN